MKATNAMLEDAIKIPQVAVPRKKKPSGADLLRPTTWDEFVGQTKLKRRLDVHLSAAMAQERTLDPIFLAGPPGFGKTSLAAIIAHRMNVQLTDLTMPMTERALIQAFRAFRSPGVFFMDELHTLSKGIQEFLLPVVESSQYVDRRGRVYPLENMTLIAATTERDKVITPLFDRFPIKPEFGEYSEEEMNSIVAGMSTRAHVRLPKEVITRLGIAAGGVPRSAQQLVYAARDLRATGVDPTLGAILALVEIDQDGLTAMHVRYLDCLADGGGIAGLKTLEMMLRVPNSVLRELERLLLNRKYIDYTPGGREITPQGMARINHGRMELST